MVQDTDTTSTPEQRASSSRTRRSYLTLTGAGIGLAALTGTSAATAQSDPEEEEDDGGTVETEDGSGDSSSVFDDLIDPVWGYPLAADESDAVSFEHIVEMGVEEGDGSHPDFPVDPESGEVIPVEFPFDPVGLHLTPGEIVQFRTVGDAEHTATAFHEKFGTPDAPMPTRVPDCVPGFTSPPIMNDESWLYAFHTKGVYDILCLPHLGLGMVMRVVVFDPETDDIEDETFSLEQYGTPPSDPFAANAVAVLTADELAPAQIVEAGTVAWADLTLEVPEITPAPEETPPDNGF